MAATFNNAADRISATTFVSPGSAGSIAFWLKPSWASGDGTWRNLLYIGSESPLARIDILRFSDNNIYVGWLTAAGGDDRIAVSDSGIFSNGVWASYVYTWDDTADDQKLYQNNVQIGSRTTTLDTASLSGDYVIGNVLASLGDQSATGDIAEFAEWSAVLTSAERAALAAGYSPRLVRPASLAKYLTLVREVQEHRGTSFSNSGTDPASHPRVIYPKRRVA